MHYYIILSEVFTQEEATNMLLVGSVGIVLVCFVALWPLMRRTQDTIDDRRGVGRGIID